MGKYSKLAGATLGGAVGTLIVWGIQMTGTEVPAEVGAAIATICGAILTYFFPANEQATQ
jgi:hypothetical protein